MRAGRYRAPPVKRVWLDKADGRRRPIGLPSFEDKIVQRAVVMLLGAVYDQDFHDFSHGFREGHSAHQALRELRERCMRNNIGWIVDADVSGMLLGAVYEQDFQDFSHGFREGHSAHQALRELRERCMRNNIGWIVDADVSGASYAR